MYIKLTEEQHKNLFLFLERVELKGHEAVAYIQLLQALQNVEKEGER